MLFCVILHFNFFFFFFTEGGSNAGTLHGAPMQARGT